MENLKEKVEELKEYLNNVDNQQDKDEFRLKLAQFFNYQRQLNNGQ